MAINTLDYIQPTSPDEFIKVYGQSSMALAKLAHVNALIDKVNEIIGASGLSTAVTPVVRTNNPILIANSSNANIDALDAAIGANLTPVVRTNNPLVSDTSVNAKLSKLDTAIGADIQSTNYLVVDTTVNEKLAMLDTVLGMFSTNLTSGELVALGANQGNAAPVVVGMNVVTAVDGTKGIVLPAAAVGKVITIFNTDVTAANTLKLKIYPQTGEYINSALVNVAVNLNYPGGAVISHAICTYQAAGKWTVTAIVGAIS